MRSESDRPPGLVSNDHGVSWQAMGALPDPPARHDLRPLLSGNSAEGALVIDLIPDSTVGPGGSVARYASTDGGLRWSRVRCGTLPSPGCAVAARWAGIGGTRYVLFHGQVYSEAPGKSWKPLPVPLPVPSGSVLQLLAASQQGRIVPYLVTAADIWQWDGAAWRHRGAALPLGGPTPTLS